MHVICGQELYGKVDVVPGKCHVATRFFHLYYVPLIPTSSWVIRKGAVSDPGSAEQQIRMSFKSICIGWLMSLLIIFGVIAVAHAGVELYSGLARVNVVNSWLELGAGLTSIAVWILFLARPLQASPERAIELLTHLGLSTEGYDPEAWDLDQTDYNSDAARWDDSSLKKSR